MNIGCHMVPHTRDIFIFGGYDALGDQKSTGSLLVIENEERNIHTMADNVEIALESADAFPNCGCIYKNGEDTIICGVSSVWAVNDKTG